MTFVTQPIKSQYLGEEFEASCWEMKQKSGRTLLIVEHAAFEDIIFNKLKKEGFSYELTPILGIANYPVMRCSMGDASGRKIIAIGEAHPNSLVNAISKQNPVIMAGNRAFDRAAIRYLDLEGKVYSSEEIPTDDSNDEDPVEQEPFATEDEYADENVGNETPSESETSAESYGTVVVHLGRYRSQNKTVAQIWEEDESWAKYTANMNTDSAGNTTKFQVKALRAYGESRGVKFD